MNRRTTILIALSLCVFLLFPQHSAQAHQPYCEAADLTADTPWQVPDASVSYAYYGNLYPASDVDYFTFEATAGQSVLLSLSIPAIDGQEDFTPVMVVYGPGVDVGLPDDLPADLTVAKGEGAMMVPLGDEAEYWYEPFGGRYYWNWDNYFFEAPEAATYTVALWHPEGALGRYSFVVGEKEIFGGDQECMAAMDEYWTPLAAGESPYPESAMDMTDQTHVHADGMMHDHGKPLEVEMDAAPYVDLQLIPLADGGYNVRIQTLNFTFAPQKVGMEPQADEGHAHLYIDGIKIARIYSEWFHLDVLPADAEMVSVGLYANNHQPLAVDGAPISDMVVIADVTSTQAVATME